METLAKKIFLKPGANEAVAEWAGFLNANRDEVLASLADEGVVRERAYFFPQTPSTEGYLLYTMTAYDFDHAGNVADQSQRPVDVHHRRFKAVWWDRLEDIPLEDFQALTADRTPIVDFLRESAVCSHDDRHRYTLS